MRFLTVALFLIMAGNIAGAETLRQITVTGQGRVEAAPDMATITLGVTTERAAADDAMRGNAEQVARMLEVLRAEGIEGRDMQTGNLNLHPRHAPGGSGTGGIRITGFAATSTVAVRVRDIQALGRILDLVLEAGVNRMHGLHFGFADPEARQDIARMAAIRDARRKAELYATAAGAGLGRVIAISETGSTAQRPAMMQAQASARVRADIPIAGGEVTTRATVTVVHELIDN